jgi:hypothetical protein
MNLAEIKIVAVIDDKITAADQATMEHDWEEYRAHPEKFTTLDDLIARDYPAGLPVGRVRIEIDPSVKKSRRRRQLTAK